MFAPTPAICGNGHAAMIRATPVNDDLMKKQRQTETQQNKAEQKKVPYWHHR